jgi:hypothetical protein
MIEVRTSPERLSMCRPKWVDSISQTFSPRTLLPWSSSGGEKVPSPSCAGSAATMPPPTPLLAGMPTR